jgi:hypothetical protein
MSKQEYIDQMSGLLQELLSSSEDKDLLETSSDEEERLFNKYKYILREGLIFDREVKFLKDTTYWLLGKLSTVYDDRDKVNKIKQFFITYFNGECIVSTDVYNEVVEDVWNMRNVHLGKFPGDITLMLEESTSIIRTAEYNDLEGVSSNSDISGNSDNVLTNV